MTLELGGNIALSGFSDRDFTEMIIIKKMVGQYARKLTDTMPGFSRLTIHLKDVHHTEEGHGKYEITTTVIVDGHEAMAESIDHNIFVALDNSLKHVLVQLQKMHDKQHPGF